MRRGFKSWCENVSAEYRSNLGLERDAVLDPRDLARYLDVRVWTPHEVPGLSQASIEQLIETDPASWSAVTLAVNGQNVVILNSAHAPTRQRSSLAHELAHLALNHRAARTTVSDEGFLFSDRFDEEQEEEADWLSGALLLPREGLLNAYRRSRASAVVARHFGVSTNLVDWRLRMTGILMQTQRAARMWRGRVG